MSEKQDPLVELYGENALALALVEIETLKAQSNIPFTAEYVGLSIGFMKHKAAEILEKKTPELSLNVLVSQSFGEAAIATYNL